MDFWLPARANGGLGFPWEIDSLKLKYLQLWQSWLFVRLNKLKVPYPC